MENKSIFFRDFWNDEMPHFFGQLLAWMEAVAEILSVRITVAAGAVYMRHLNKHIINSIN